MIFDTNFLIALQRERRRQPGPAHAFLEAHRAERVRIPATVAGEYAEGFESFDDPACVELLRLFELLDITGETARRYAAITRELRGKGQLIGTNDLWIAASALEHSETLVTRNADEFRRIPGLNVVTF